MKVLEKGNPQKGWSVKTSCTGGCGAKLLVEQADLFKTSSHVKGKRDVFITFKCVDCGVLTDLSTQQKPPKNIVSVLPDQKDWVDPNSEKAKMKQVIAASKLLEEEGFVVRKLDDYERNQEMMGS